MSELPPHRLPPDINDGQAVGGSGAAGGATASQDKGYSSILLPKSTKWIEVYLQKSRNESFKLNENEIAKMIKKLNVNTKKLISYSSHDEVNGRLMMEVDSSLDLSEVCLHEAIEIREGLRTRPVFEHAHMTQVRIYRTAVTDSHDDIIAFLSPFGEVTEVEYQGFNIKPYSPEELKALVNVKKGDRIAHIKLQKFIPTWGYFVNSEGVARRVKMTWSCWRSYGFSI